MKKGIFSLLMAMLAIVGFANAQVVEIGSGISTSGTVPTSSSYCYSYTQELWTAEEIGRSGTISSIAFNTVADPCSFDRNIVVYMKNVSRTSFASTSDWEPIAASDQVFSGTLPKDGNGWITLELTTPFVYDGTSSLMIAIDDNTGSYSSKYYFYNSAPGKLLYFRSDSSNPDPFNLGAFYGSMYAGSIRANIQITFSDDLPAGPELAVEPEINMSFRPNNAWMAPFETALINITTGAVNVNNIDFANVAVFSLAETPEYPISLEADEEYTLGLVTVRDEETEGDVNTTMTVTTDTRQASLFDVTASLYTAVEPDVWEFAREVTAFPYTDELADTIALYDNYDLPGSNEDGLDAVYKLVLEHDCVLNASVRGDNPKVAIYDENFGGQPGPMVDNTYPYEPNAGDFSEGFETGVFDANWAQGSPYGFVIDNSEAHSGTFSAKSNNYQISSSEAQMTLTYNVPADGQISFFWKFSGEGYSYDHPKFYIDGTLMTPTSGWTSGGFDWTQATFAVTAGEHTFTWGYKKDSSVSGGQDRLWVDDITIGATRANTVTRENNELVDKFLPAGTYYLVASATSQPFIVSINAANAPCPEQATNFVPADDDDDVDPTRLTLSWELDEYATEYRLVFGSTYYCTETLVDWTSDLAESYTFAEALYNNTNYFWRVDQRNTECETLGEAIGFTTNFNRPTNLRSTSANGTNLYEGDVLNLKWDAIADRTFRQYNIYQDGELIGSTTNTYNPDTYTTYNVEGLTYNPEGYTFNVTALYDEGESGFSNNLVVFVAGEGEVDGHVYEQDGTTGIANATVTMTGEDVYGREQTYTFTTDAEGYYHGSILEGTYDGVATCGGYQDKPYEDNPIEIFFDSLVADIDYIMDEVFAPVAQVIAEYYPDPEDPQSPYVKVYWDWSLMTGIVEDFETGDFSLLEWDNTVTANYPWQVTTNNPYEGTYCMKSGNAGVNSSTSSIQVTVEIPNDGNMSFYVKASCENNYDKGYFYIDGEQKGSYTGTTNWANKTYAVTAGQHTFKWSYTKDSSVSSGDDCIYVDYIDFYQKPEPVQPGWQYYDDGVNVDAVGLAQGGSFLWGICFPSTMMGSFTGCTLSKVSMFDYSAHTGKIMIYQGGTSAPGTLVHQQPYTCTGAKDFVETTLTSAIPVDPTQSLWIVLNNDNGGYVAATCQNSGDPNGRWISLDGTDWADLASYGLDGTWMIRGYIGNAKGGRMYEASDNYVKPIQPEFVVSNASASDLSLDPADTKPVVTKSASADASRAFQYFRVYRTDCYNFDYNLENTTVLCCELTDTAYIDVSWPDAAPGVYKWGVGCVYGGNRESEITWAEPVKVPATATRESFNYGFDNDLQGWTNIDNDGDGHVWYHSSEADGLSSGNHNVSPIASHTGTGHLMGESYCNQQHGPLTPDDYLVSPQKYAISNGSSIKFWACAQDENYAAEHFGIAVSTNGNTNASDFTTIKEWTLTAKSGLASDPTATRESKGNRSGNWYEFTCDLSAYAGQEAWIAIRHFNCTDEFLMCIDDVTINTGQGGGGTTASLQEERESPIVWSNCLDKDMFLGDAEVSVTVLLNSADSPEGVNVTFTNLDEAEQEMYPVDPVTLDETGYYAWNSFRKGEYAVAVSRDGYIGENDTVSIWEATNLRYVLTEIIYGVENLYVSHTGWAMWEGHGDVGPVPPIPPVPGDDVIVKLTAGDNWGDGSGYQMLLDPTAALFGNIIPETGALSMNCTGNESIYDAFGYKIPENADGNCSTQNIVINNTVSITIPAGTYDWCITNPTPGDRIWIASSQGNVGGRQNDYVFEAGKTYEFVVSMEGYNDAVNVTITENGKRFVPAANVVPQGEGDVRVSNGIAKANTANNGGRHLESYKVLCTSIDGEPIFSGNTENPFLQLPTESLVEGDNYLVKVAAIYSTGMSEWTEAIWQYKSCENYEGINEVTLESGATGNVLTWVGLGGGTPPVPPVPGDEVTVKLTAGDNWGDGSGYQMLLDPTAALFGNIIPETGALSMNCTGNESIYDAFEYKIPENADGNCSTQNIVINNTVSITIPAGTYDWCITNPTPGDRIWIASGQGNVGGRQNDYVFEAGKTYEFVVSMMGQNDAVNVTITENGKRIVPAANAVPQGEGDVRVGENNNRNVVFNQAIFVTDPGQINGHDASNTQGGQGTFGPNVNYNGPYYIGDDFTLDATTTISGIEVFGYQTGSTTTSTFNGLYAQIYNGNPMSGGQVVWGDMSTNLMTSTSWTDCYRAYNDMNTDRPIMSIKGDNLSIELEAGTYYLVWGLTGTGASGPWGQPVAIKGQTNTGNGIQFANGSWQTLTDGSCYDPYGVAFSLYGEGGSGGGGGGTTADIVGYMVFRDGEYLGLTTETTFTDAEGGQHEYCVRVVYNGPAELPENNEYYSMSCPVCVDGGTSSCPAPEDLYAEYTWNNDGTYGTTLTWPYEAPATPVSEWLYYDNGTYATSIGAGGTIYWGSMFPSAAIAQYDGTSLTKVAVCSSKPCTATLNIHYGGDTPATGTLVHTQQVNFTGTGDFMEIALSTALPLDVTQNLWITFYQSGESYPADACVDTGDANNRWVSQDGVEWLDLAPAGLPGYGWMVRGFVTNEAKGGMITELPAFKGNAGNGELSHTEVTSRKLDMSFMSGELDHYNIYRSTSQGNYTLIGEAPANAHTYFDNLTGNAGVYYYQVTAVYGQGDDECESEPASAYQSTNDYVMVEVTSIAENDATALYPNPTSGNITINAKNMNRVTVMSVLGQVVYDAAVNSDECVINMAQFNAGVYMVRIATENGVSTKRVTVVK